MKRAAARSPLLSAATLRARGCPFPTRPLQIAYAPRRARLSLLPSGKHQWGLGLPLHRGSVVARRRCAARHGDSSIEARSPDANGATRPGMHGGCTPSTARAALRGKPVAPCRAGNWGCVRCVRRRRPAGISRAVMRVTPQTRPIRRGALVAGESNVARSKLRAESATMTARERAATVLSGRCRPSHALSKFRLRTEKQHAAENYRHRASSANL